MLHQLRLEPPKASPGGEFAAFPIRVGGPSARREAEPAAAESPPQPQSPGPRLDRLHLRPSQPRAEVSLGGGGRRLPHGALVRLRNLEERHESGGPPRWWPGEADRTNPYAWFLLPIAARSIGERGERGVWGRPPLGGGKSKLRLDSIQAAAACPD
ncbi:hypothetical protein SEVIR_4G288066v4 [Setaria viridis]